MPRANRHYIPHCVWHITHRCHKKEFLLKFTKDKKRWIAWLYEAKKQEACWSESFAVGKKKYLENIKDQLGYRGERRKVMKGDTGFELRESLAPYNSLFVGEKGGLRLQSDYSWEV